MSEIDPELDATWRAASREQPPTALDDAIRAAARREVGAKPGGFGAAPRWWPLATAATVAAIAVGIAQMTPPRPRARRGTGRPRPADSFRKRKRLSRVSGRRLSLWKKRPNASRI